MKNAQRAEFPHFLAIPTRWMDNDVYGHVNNVVYYSYFDTAVNQFLIERGVLDIHKGEVVGFVVDSGCAYFSSISFPDTVHAGIRVAKLGNSSVRYEIALYRNDEALPCAAGHFVHVYVERSSNRSVPVPAAVRAVLDTIRVATPGN
ncbi:MAG TPA: thioesterase family protein [Telluria sp.]|jgi:acyl-CoA thioester hydrolase